jgi:hypothetical protein
MPNSCIKHGTDGSGNELWVATGGSTNGANTIAYSYDGINWNVAKGTQFYSQGLGLDYGADQSGNIVWLAGGWSSGQTNTLAYSKDGITWTSLGSPGSFVVYGIAFGYTATGVPLWIACGDGSKYAYSSNPTVLASWTTVTDTKMTTWRKMLYSNTSNGSPLWVAVGTGTNSIAYSTSGISGWTGIGTQIFTGAHSVDYGIDGSKNLVWWAGGTSTGNTIATSANGINWTGRGKHTITGTGFGTGYGLDLSDNPILMTVGNGTGVSHVYSYYGTTWSVVHKASFSVAMYSIAQQRIPKYIAGGTGIINMKGSLDGRIWYYIPSPFTLATYDVYWSQSQQLWVAVGEGTNTVAYSSNGLTWTGLGTTIFSIRGRKVTFSNTQNMWFIAGEGTNTLAASYDGKAWMPITSTAGYVDQIGAGLYVK